MELYRGPAFSLKSIEGTPFLELSFNLEKESVNKFNAEALCDLAGAIAKIPTSANSATFAGLLVSSGKESFIAGADITEFLTHFKRTEKELESWIGETQSLFSKIEDLPVPTVAIINGFALGGGLEFALCADFRIAGNGTKIGLPETKLGIIPGWGGTVRLPRAIGLDSALEWITTGNQYDANVGLKYGVIDAVVAPADLRNAGIDLLHQLQSGNIDWSQRRSKKQQPLPLNKTEQAMAFSINKAGVFAVAGSNYPAPLKAIEVIERAAKGSRAEAMTSEAAGFAQVSKSDAAQALVGNFLADQMVKKKAKAQKSLAKPIDRAAVLGAGIMGGGIAYQSATSQIPIFMKDIQASALDRGMSEAAGLLEKQIQRGKLTPSQMAVTLSKIQPTLKMEDLKTANFVIEAVTENQKVKVAVLKEVEALLPAGAFLTSNTSTISISLLAESLQHPDRFCGMHFFNPVPKMPLVEIIRGKKTAKETIATAVQYSLAMGKTPIVVNDCPGFLINRVLFAYLTAFNQLIAEGIDFIRIDRVMEKWGWPMGPAYLSDVVGIDTAHHAAAVMGEGFPDRMKLDPNFSTVKLFQAQRFGQKNGKGFYVYSLDPKGKPKKEVQAEIYSILGQDPQSASFKKTNEAMTDAQIIDRLMIPFIFESARCLEEGIVETAMELDLGMLLGLGFPPFRGGPCRFADSIGSKSLLERSTVLQKTHGPLYQAPKIIQNQEKFHE